MRYILLLLVILVAWRTKAWIRMKQKYYTIHVLFGLLFIGLALRFAENIATFLGAWVYPSQTDAWIMVSLSKILSWFLLFIISIVIVSVYKMKFGKKMKEFDYKSKFQGRKIL